MYLNSQSIQGGGAGGRLGTFPFALQRTEDPAVERGIDQLVEVDQAAEVDGELLQLPADWKKAPGEGRRALMLAGLQRGQEVALNPRLWREIGESQHKSQGNDK